MSQRVQIIARIRRLGVAGLSAEAIARVIELDYGQRPPMSLVKDQVKRVGAARAAVAGVSGAGGRRGVTA